jgi:hypothetical protein
MGYSSTIKLVSQSAQLALPPSMEIAKPAPQDASTVQPIPAPSVPQDYIFIKETAPPDVHQDHTPIPRLVNALSAIVPAATA